MNRIPIPAILRIALFLLIDLLIVGKAFGYACTAKAGGGNWGTASTWSSCNSTVPQAGDTVTIGSGITVTLNTNTNNISSLTVSGTLSNTGGTSYTINLAGDLAVTGTLTNTGGSTSQILLQQNSNWSGSGTVSLDYLDMNSKTINLASAATLKIHLTDANPIRNITSNGFNYGGTPNTSNATIYLDGAAQTVPSSNIQYPDLSVSGGTKTVSAGALTLLGDLTIAAGSTFDATSATATSLAGNLNLSGTLTSGTGLWTFNGTALQTISAAATIYNMQVNNSHDVAISGNLTLGNASSGSLTLTAGGINTGSNSVVVPQPCSNAWMTRSAGSWINGNLQLTAPAAAATCIFYVGDASNYAPITFTYPAHAAPLGGSITGSTTTGDHPDTTAKVSGIDPTKSVNRYWTLTPAGTATFYSYTATLQYCNATGTADCTVNDVDAAAAPGSFVVAEKVAGFWTSFTPTAPTTNSRLVSINSGFGNFAIGDTLVVACNPPSNIPAGITVTCQCDNFGRASLDPSPIFNGGNWAVSTSDSTGVVPYINATSGYLRLTENTGNNAKAATVPGIFPASGNYISVEFRHFAYNGSNPGADGIAVTLSDYSVPAVPGQFGGSLGYAQRNDCATLPNCPGFNGGWVGIALDEWGNYQNPTEGRIGGPGFLPETVGVRGSGQAQTGYRWLQGNAAALAPTIDNHASTTPAPGYYYQVIVDARNAATGQTFVAVNRDTTGAGTAYAAVIPSFDAFARAVSLGFTQAAVPANWQISFTGSTGGANNIHEIGGLRICAQSFVPPSGGTPGGFNAIDESYAVTASNMNQLATQGHLFMKLAGVGFNMKVAALNSTGTGVLTTYATSSSKTVTVQLIDDSGGSSSCNSSASACSSCSKPVIASQTMTFTSATTPSSGGPAALAANFTVNDAYSKVLVRMSDGTTTGCSTDVFSIRPAILTSFTTTAGNATTSGTPKLKAGTDSVTLSATASTGIATTANYTGTPKIIFELSGGKIVNTSGTATTMIPGTLSPAGFGAAVGGIASQAFTYSDTGYFVLDGYNPAYDTTSQRGIYDDTWTAVDSGSTGDCNVGSYSNTKDANGKYGCNFGLTSGNGNSTPTRNGVGRFVPDHYEASVQFAPGNTGFTYMGQSFSLTDPTTAGAMRVKALAGGQTFATSLGLQNYAASASSPATVWFGAANGSSSTADLVGRISPAMPAQATPSSAWANGVYTAPAGPFTFSQPSTTTPDATWGPYDTLNIGIALSDPDGGVLTVPTGAPFTLTLSGTPYTYQAINGTTPAVMRYGRVRMENAFGSELLVLPMRMVAEYYAGSGWAQNTLDSSTALATPAMSSYTRNLSAGQTTPTLWSPLKTGNAGLQLSAPGFGHNGSVLLTTTVPSYLQFNWTGTGAINPSARGTFGTVGSRNQQIFLRENY